MRILYLALSLLPSVALLTLAWVVVRAVSVRVVWRGSEARRANDGRA
jgi:hypothetical protein